MKKLLRLLVLMFAGVTAAGCSTVRLPAVPVSNTEAIEAWSRVLTNFVNEKGQIDFVGLQENPRDLLVYLHYVSTAEPILFFSDDERLAHYINAYNAASMYGVIEAGIPATNASAIAKFRFFYLKRYTLDGKKQSLYNYEESIRNLGDPRVHFVLNCMSVGCPVLPRTPFQPAGLQAFLDKCTRDFFADPSKLVVMPENQTVAVSEILKFYQPEFLAKANSLIDYVNQYVPNPIPQDYKVEFIPYDWTFNIQR